MSSSYIQPIANALKAKLEGLSLATSIKVPSGAWARDHVNPPAAEIEIPDVRRAGVDEPERQLGTRDFPLEYLVTLWFDLREPTVAQQRLVEALEKWVDAIDAAPTLGLSFVEDSKVVHAARVYELQPDRKRALVGYETTVEVLALIPNV